MPEIIACVRQAVWAQMLRPSVHSDLFLHWHTIYVGSQQVEPPLSLWIHIPAAETALESVENLPEGVDGFLLSV